MLNKAKLNAIASYLNFILTSFLVFFVSPILVNYLGATVFGVWKSIEKILSFATIADGRATQALKWVIASDENNNDVKIKQQSVGSTLKVWIYFLPLVLLIILLLVWNLPFLINGLDKQIYSKVYQVGFILGINLLINPLMGIPDAILVGTNNGYKSTIIQTIGVVLSNLLMLLVSYLGYGIVGLGFVVLFITLANAFFIFYICKRNIPWLGIQKPTKEQVQVFYKFSFWVFLWTFVLKLLLYTEILLIGYLISPDYVTNYVFSTYIVQLAISVALLTGSAITPTLGRLFGAKDMKTTRIWIKKVRELILLISLFFGCLILIINKYFLNLWMGDIYYIGNYNNLLVVLIMVFLVLVRIEGQLLDITLDIKNKVLSGAGLTILGIALGVFGFYYLGESIEGLFLGILTGRVILYFVFSSMVNTIMKTTFNYKNFFFLICFLSVAFLLKTIIPNPKSWLEFMIFVIITTIPLLILCFLLLSRELRIMIINTIKNKIN